MAIEGIAGLLASWRSTVQILLSAISGTIIVKVIYNIYFHPLASFPGPLARKATRLPWTISMMRGQCPYAVEELHQKYGPVVRIAPGELSFQDARVWHDIMGGGNSDIPKWEGMYGVPKFIPPHIQNTINKDHHRMLRKALSPGFSESSLRAQEPLLQQYITTLINRLSEEDAPDNATSGQKRGRVVNLEMWYRFLVLDIICDLALGESLGCLTSDTVHPWISTLQSAGGAMKALVAINMYPTLAATLNWLIGDQAKTTAAEYAELLRPAIERRLEQGDARQDLVNPLIKLQNKAKTERLKDPSATAIDDKAALDDMLTNAQTIIGAGGDTTATTLAAVTSLLIDNPPALERVQKEVRGSFATEADITATDVSRKLPYMRACIDEALRLFPTTGAPSMRKTDQVTNICGTAVPKDTIVGIWTWGLFRTPKFWTAPEEFHPERWLGEEARFKDDPLELCKPFFTGSRDCIGQNLAVLELRLVLARMIYNFDFEYADEDSREWTKKQVHAFIVWNKSPLNVRLLPR
ncbi:cytochrome P450 [Microdochium bolleyi]|uniref:Cytochrome P450 n=1 Tax=Microdochium bolleyi TaxID=196109 RepID=A0A136IW02_9PEZI|nr:cytochrome P450 [Microdochium bolleyi]